MCSPSGNWAGGPPRRHASTSGASCANRACPRSRFATLTALFEEARFSRHPIPESAPRRAASELQTARVALAAATHDAETA
jgi:hypothetical protein